MGNDDAYYAQTPSTLEPAYLAADNPRAQSGFSRAAAAWERARRVITAPMNRDGDFMDIGCASGHLMETIHEWCGQDGHRVEPHGLDLSERLVQLARSRVPRWASRIHVGNVMTWDPRRRCDFVTRVAWVEA